MSDALQYVNTAIDGEIGDGHPLTRRRVLGGAAAALGGMGLLGVLPPAQALAAQPGNDPQTILNVGATAEALATIVTTLGYRKDLGGDDVTRANVGTASYEELIHYQYLVGLGGVPATKSIWVPDAVFANRTGLLSTIVAGDQIFVNAYLIATAVFAAGGQPELAAIPAEIMGVEAVHRALALQSLGGLGNDRAFMRVAFTKITDAVGALQAAGIGFGSPGASPGSFYDFDFVSRQTPSFTEVNTLKPTPIAP
jgi:hypothetical protein